MSGPTPPAAAAEPLTQTQTQDLAALAEGEPKVAILAGSTIDMDRLEPAEGILGRAGVRYETRVMSPHHEPDTVADYCRNARMRGLRVIIAGSGLSAALAGIAAAHSDLPVIGVPLSGPGTAGGGLDAILSTVQTPAGVPVAAVGLDNAANAAELALRILRA
jgi:5-(carboxyamino)imidazole ribonucleotide mutase